MTNKFWKGETYAIVKAMKATGNRPGVITEWKQSVERWALNSVNDPQAIAVRAWLPFWQVRPFYTAEELAPMWPALAIAVGHTDRWPLVLKSAKRLGHELDFANLPSRKVGRQKMYIVERIPFWSKALPHEIEREFHAHA